MSAPEIGARSLEAVPSTDAELVMRVIHGERNAYAGLVRRYQETLYRYVRGMGLDHETTLDLVQDAFVKAYTRIGACREPAHFGAWLFSIGRNICLDHLKNIRRFSVPLSMLPGAERIPSTEAEQSELKRALREALDMLSPGLRDAFLLKHYLGYTYEEAAEIAQVSASAVKMRVHRARETLRAFLTDRGLGAAQVTMERVPIVLPNEKHENDRADCREGESIRRNKEEV